MTQTADTPSTAPTPSPALTTGQVNAYSRIGQLRAQDHGPSLLTLQTCRSRARRIAVLWKRIQRFSPDLAGALQDGQVWTEQTGDLLLSAAGPDGGLVAVRWSKDHLEQVEHDLQHWPLRALGDLHLQRGGLPDHDRLTLTGWTPLPGRTQGWLDIDRHRQPLDRTDGLYQPILTFLGLLVTFSGMGLWMLTPPARWSVLAALLFSLGLPLLLTAAMLLTRAFGDICDPLASHKTLLKRRADFHQALCTAGVLSTEDRMPTPEVGAPRPALPTHY